MNFFMFIKNENGERELVTPNLDGTILPGVTRDSILSLTREWKEFKVSERPIRMAEVIKAVEEKRVLEMFGAGTVFYLNLYLHAGGYCISHQKDSF
jgi:branched-chain amino acid aminotransferase